MKPRFIACAFFAFAAVDAAAAMYRCVTPGGGVSYQELPCAREDAGGPVNVPSEFPEINAEGRARLLQREADMYRRLEAERERLSREEMTRISARAQVAAAQASAPVAADPPIYYAPAWPMAFPRPHFGVNRVPPPRMMLR
jgi:hypothetical protein